MFIIFIAENHLSTYRSNQNGIWIPWYHITRKNNMKVISIDLGATSGRVMIVHHENHRFTYEEVKRFDNRTYLDKEGYLRWDFSLLFDNIVSGIQDALKKEEDIASISIDSWAIDYGFVKDGKLYRDPLCYRDTHSFKGQKEFLEKVPFEKLYSIVGIQNLHFNTVYQLYSDTTDFQVMDCLLMIPDLIAYFLTGNARLEETNASTTSFYCYKEKKLSDGLLKEIGIPKRLFPKLIEPGESYGNLKKEYWSKKEIPVLACASHDTASAVLGANGAGRFAYISSGTWSLIGTELKSPIMNDESRKANFTNEIGYDDTVRFLKNTMGMFLINETRNDYRKHGTEIKIGDIARLVNESADTKTYLDVNDPCFETPGDMLEKIKAYVERTSQILPSTPGEMMKAIYKSMALSYRKIIENLERLTNRSIDSILVVGGGNQADVLNQYTADACKVKVITGASEATVLGNAMAQFISLKDIQSVEEGRADIKNSIQGRTFQPKDEDYWDKEYDAYQKAINQR